MNHNPQDKSEYGMLLHLVPPTMMLLRHAKGYTLTHKGVTQIASDRAAVLKLLRLALTPHDKSLARPPH